MAGRKHLVAVNRTIRAAKLDEAGLDAAIVELARDCAREMDAAGTSRSLNLMRAYQSSLKDLQRAAERVAAFQPLPRLDVENGSSEDAGEPVEGGAKVSALDAWREQQSG